jgi:hypothetical protein
MCCSIAGVKKTCPNFSLLSYLTYGHQILLFCVEEKWMEIT